MLPWVEALSIMTLLPFFPEGLFISLRVVYVFVTPLLTIVVWKSTLSNSTHHHQIPHLLCFPVATQPPDLTVAILHGACGSIERAAAHFGGFSVVALCFAKNTCGQYVTSLFLTEAVSSCTEQEGGSQTMEEYRECFIFSLSKIKQLCRLWIVFDFSNTYSKETV